MGGVFGLSRDMSDARGHHRTEAWDAFLRQVSGTGQHAGEKARAIFHQGEQQCEEVLAGFCDQLRDRYDAEVEEAKRAAASSWHAKIPPNNPYVPHTMKRYKFSPNEEYVLFAYRRPRRNFFQKLFCR